MTLLPQGSPLGSPATPPKMQKVKAVFGRTKTLSPLRSDTRTSNEPAGSQVHAV